MVYERAEFLAYCCAERNDRGATVVRKEMAVNVYHEQGVGLSLPLHDRIRVARKEIDRAHGEAGNQTRVKRP